VDIISMSFGFDHEIPGANNRLAISNALSDALHTRNQQILFFAAAANEGGNQPEMFPANHPHVISIRGTDDKGWLQRYNPPRGYADMDCFMTLGQDVPGAGLSSLDGEEAEAYHSGTSVSTPIAAGIAGILLSYARLYKDDLYKYLGARDGVTRASGLATVAGMRKILARLSTEMLDGYYYLSAEAFLKLTTHESRIGALGGSLL
jgi:subtilisin family serine protease